jgi:AraC-like DNA-binding protein
MNAILLPSMPIESALSFNSPQQLSKNHRFKLKSYDIPAIERAKEIIDSNVTDHWSLCLLAAKAGINEFKLKAGFRYLYKTSPYKYLVKLRLEKSIDLLQNTDLTIQLVADRVGFDDFRGYNKAFRKSYGMLPTEFRSRSEGFSQILYKTTLVNQL